MIRSSDYSDTITKQTNSSVKQDEGGQTIHRATGDPAEPYTIFSTPARWSIVTLLGISTLASPLTATIYLPLLPILASAFNVTLQQINLTLTVYIIFQATAPILLASPSDYSGRRPIFLISFTLFTFASLGLALTKASYTALIILRAVQSLGASTILSVSNAVVADICTSAQRGKLLGPLMVTANLGTAVGPIIGGWIVYGSRDFRWAFWALLMFAAVMWVLLLLFLPETARNVVGNGSAHEKWWNRPIWSVIRTKIARNTDQGLEDVGKIDYQTAIVAKHKIRLKSPLASVRVLFYADTSLIIWIGASYYAAWYCIQASIPLIYTDYYHFNELQVGLAYIPGAIGTIISMYISAQAADKLVRKEAERLGMDYNNIKNSNQDLSEFHFEEARTRFCKVLLVVSFVMYAGFGWLVQERVHVSAPLIFQFLIAVVNTYICQVYSVLILDGFAKTTATAATANNVSRYALAAIAVTVLNPCVKAIGYGWFMSGLGFLTGILGLGAQVLLSACGMRWRISRQHPAQN